jgi:mannose-6-phosphate isomerase-like protein (cupin superfamily)
MSETWMFLGVRVEVRTDPDAPVVVAEGLLPSGASPPLHVHANLDDSFYLLDGRMVVRCGDTNVGTPMEHDEAENWLRALV